MDGVLGTWQLKHTSFCRNPPLLDQIASTDKSDKKKTSQFKKIVIIHKKPAKPVESHICFIWLYGNV